MRVSLNWLSDYVDIHIDPPALADLLTMAGLEVEAVEDRYQYLNTVIVGRITSVSPHPKADRLRICEVDLGDHTATIVCGAPNAAPEIKVPCALPGTELPSGQTVASSTIRGVISDGMLCSEAELELGPDRSGLMLLPPKTAVGSPLSAALRLRDTRFEIGLTPNRSDCLSFIGIAREVAAILDTPLKYPAIDLPKGDGNIFDYTSVTIESPDLCPRYAARLVTDITVAPSPAWLQDRLRSIGLKPINNIVDITNFVMMETGQPLHAFDFDRLAENRIVVRTPGGESTFTTLDGKTRELTDETLMICDGIQPVAVAGVMGGENSEIEMSTTRVLIESAYFTPVSIRKTAKRLGLSTDAAYRFERGVDPDGTIAAVNRAARLMVEIGGGRLIDGIIDEHPQPTAPKTITLDINRTNRYLGTRLGQDEIVNHLESIEFSVTPIDPDTIRVIPPSFRVDVDRPEDLMEEVARLWGYNNIVTTFPQINAHSAPPQPPLLIREQIRDILCGFGFHEAIHYSFIAKNAADRLDLPATDRRQNTLAILNPLSEDQAVMRTSLIPGLLESMRQNTFRQEKNLKLFELGKTFYSKGADQLPDEIEMLAGLWTGSRFPATWHARPAPVDFYDIKGVVESILDTLGLRDIVYSRMPKADCHYIRHGQAAQISCNGEVIGHIGPIVSRVLKQFDVKQPVYIFEITADTLMRHVPDICQFQPIPRFPYVARDITLIVDQAIEGGEIINRALAFDEDLLEELYLLDVYIGKPIPEGKKSISVRVIYRSFTETLEDERVNAIHQGISKRLIQAFNATLPE